MKSSLTFIEQLCLIHYSGGYNREECLRTVECYDMKTDSWSFIAPMRTPRARFQMAVLMVCTWSNGCLKSTTFKSTVKKLLFLSKQGQLYVMGGSNGHSDELSCGETYNPSADEWTQVPELRTNRCNAGKNFTYWLLAITYINTYQFQSEFVHFLQIISFR